VARPGPKPLAVEKPRSGPRRSTPRVECPDPQHTGSRVKGNGTREASGVRRRDYKCYPVGYKAHTFTVIIGEPATPLPVKTAAPECPLHDNQADITRYGTYGHKDETLLRQRYRCRPHDKTEAAKYKHGYHVFTPKLAREHIHYGQVHCDDCGELRGVHRGDQVAGRASTWPLRTVAEGLARLSAGASYGQVGIWAWDRTGRDRTRAAKLSDAERERREKATEWRRAQPRRRKGAPALDLPTELAAPYDPDPDYDRRRRTDASGNPLPRRRKPSPSAATARARWHTAADWVSSYSGALWLPLHERLLAEERAEHNRRMALTPQQRVADGRPQVLMLDDLPISTKARSDGYGNQRVKRTYFILAAGSIAWREATAPSTRSWESAENPDPKTHLRLLRGFATNEAESWILLFDELGYEPGVYEPEVVLADAGTGLQKAVRTYFKNAVLVPSLWHVQEALVEALVKKSGPGATTLTDMGPALHPRLADILADLSAERLHQMTTKQWNAWWNDLEQAMTDLDMSLDAIQDRRTKYQPAIGAVLPLLAANPSIPVSSGGFETVLRNSASTMVSGRTHALANVERCAALFDLCVCRDHGVFHNINTVVETLRKDTEEHDGWAAAPRIMADPQPPAPASYSSLRDRDLPLALATVRGLT
jgi:hypothetical protein